MLGFHQDWRAVTGKARFPVFGALRDDNGSAEITPSRVNDVSRTDGYRSLTYPVSDDLQIQIHVIHGLSPRYEIQT